MYARYVRLCGSVSESYSFFCSSASMEHACRLAVRLQLVVALVETRPELNSSTRQIYGRRFLLEPAILGEVVGLLTTSRSGYRNGRGHSRPVAREHQVLDRSLCPKAHVLTWRRYRRSFLECVETVSTSHRTSRVCAPRWSVSWKASAHME